jgi:DNA-binding transcriptional regulator YiaG
VGADEIGALAQRFAAEADGLYRGEGGRERLSRPCACEDRREAIRTSLDMSPEEFAGRFAFSINTLRHWEQGSRQPEGPTRAYLLVIELVIERAPKAVQKALQAVAG